MRRTRTVLGVAAVLIAIGGVAGVAQRPPAPLLLVLDASGSMWGQVEGENKVVIARRVLGDLVDGLADEAEVGVIAYGHRREADCADIETVVPMGPLDRTTLKASVDGLNPKGRTPITASVQQAFDTLRGRDQGATVVLLSDGLETCDGDPCAAVRAAREQGIDFVLHIIGFDVAGEDVSQLECAAQAGDGLYLAAENASELSAALNAAVAMAPDVPTGRLSIEAIADGELQDAAVSVSNVVTGEDAGTARTYASAETNPRLIPLSDGRYQVHVTAVGIRGNTQRELEVEIADGGLVERTVDFSTGELVIGTTRNGERSDAVYEVRVPDGGGEAASGRTYVSESSNPASVRITSGTYEVSIGSVEISGRPRVGLGMVTIEPGGRAELSHDWESGTLTIGTARDGTLVDATLSVVDAATGTSVGQGRTYTNPASNPKSFIVEPGEYRVTVREIRGDRRQITVTVGKGEVIERTVDPAGGG